MKALDLSKLSLKNLSGQWAVLPAAGFAIAAFCLCFAGAILLHVNEVKSMPCELEAVPPGNAGITAKLLDDVRKLPGVAAATALLPVQVEVTTGKLKAKLTLTGIDCAYLDEAFRLGSVYPENSVMPYIVLNEAACRQFTEDTGDEEESEWVTMPTAAPAIDWLNASFSVLAGQGGRAVVSKVCGVLAGYEEGQASAAYISLNAAKELLKGQNVKPESVRVRIENIGYASEVTRALSGLGFRAENADEALQAKWDAETSEMSYLILTGSFGLIYSAVLLAARRKLFLLEHKDSVAMLLWLGMRSKDIGSMFIIQSLFIAALGAAIGILTSISLPSFLAQDLHGVSVFSLSIPGVVAAISAAGCLAAGVFPMMNSTLHIKKITQLYR